MLQCLSLKYRKKFFSFTNTALEVSSSKANFSSESTVIDSMSMLHTNFSSHKGLTPVLDTPPTHTGSLASMSPGFPPTP